MDRTQTDKAWRDQLLGKAFLDALYGAYEADPDKSYALAEEDYQRAVRALDKIPSKQKTLLEEAQRRYAENRAYAARYGFFCGLFVGVRWSFDHEGPGKDEGFMELVERGLFMVPGMERHRRYFENQGRCNSIYDEMNKALGKGWKENLVSIDCAWDERIHHAAYTGFHCGYAVAQDVIWNVVREE